jgi:DNA-binding response OmpR family regulator
MSTLYCNTVVILDDHEDTVEMLVELLGLVGYDAEGYTDALAGLARLTRPPMPRLALVDHWMIGLDGLGVTRAVRAAGVDVPLVLLTGALLEPSARHALRSLGVTEILTKPLGLNELTRVIEALGRGGGHAAPCP